jgi:hypothetical protein
MAIYRMKVGLTYGTGSTRGVNTWHFRTAGSVIDQAQIDQCVNAVSQFYLAVAGLWGSDNRAIFDGALTEVGTATPAAGVAGTAFNRQGTASGVTPGPAGVGACITWRSSLATRSGRGRTFIVPLYTNAYESNGTLSAGALTTLQGAANSLVSSSKAFGNGALGVYGGTPAQLRDFVSATVTDKVAWLSTRRG